MRLTLSSLRSGIIFALTAAAAAAQDPAAATTPAAPAPAAPPPAAASAPAVEPQDTAEAKLAIVLRSYTLMRDENDQLKAERDKLVAEKAAIEAQLGTAKGAIPLAEQAGTLREQLRQMQDQLAALSLENNQLKTKLALNGPAPGALASPASLHPTEVVSTPVPRVEEHRAPAPTTPAGAAESASANVSSSGAATAAPAATPNIPPGARTHVVVAGDTLMKISKKYYGTTTRWTEIFVANPDVLKDEKSLIIGRTLRIP